MLTSSTSTLGATGATTGVVTGETTVGAEATVRTRGAAAKGWAKVGTLPKGTARRRTFWGAAAA